MPYKNIEDRKARDKVYKEKHKEEIKAQMKAYKEANKEKIKAQKKAWYVANIEKVKAKKKAWAEANKDKVNAKTARRRALKFRATIRLTEIDKFTIDEIYSLAKLRTEQTGFEWHVDHIKPLTKGGLHKPTNLQVVPASWNLSKGNRNCDVYNGVEQNGY